MSASVNAEGRGRKIVIVGGVAGGMSCAARARRLDETAEVIVLELLTEATGRPLDASVFKAHLRRRYIEEV